MSKVKITAVSDASKEGKNGGAGSPSFCTDPQYIGRTGETDGGLMSLGGNWIWVAVRVDDNGYWLFAPDQLQEIAE